MSPYSALSRMTKCLSTEPTSHLALNCIFMIFRSLKKPQKMAHGCKVVCAFVNDDLSAPVLNELSLQGVQLISMRCAGFDRVDLETAKNLGIQVVRVPAYSPESVAEHTVGLMMSLNRRFYKAYQRTRDANFSLEGLVGIQLPSKRLGLLELAK